MASQQKFKLQLPSAYSPAERQAIALEVIDHIRSRTQSGRDKDGRRFPSYSTEYVKSLEFRAAGKSKGKVNLTLTHEMLDALKLVQSKKGEIAIGYDRGDPINGKVEGNRIGSYGKPSGNSKKARDFLGLEDGVLDSILERFPLDNRKESKALADKILTAQSKAEVKAK